MQASDWALKYFSFDQTSNKFDLDLGVQILEWLGIWIFIWFNGWYINFQPNLEDHLSFNKRYTLQELSHMKPGVSKNRHDTQM